MIHSSLLLDDYGRRQTWWTLAHRCRPERLPRDRSTLPGTTILVPSPLSAAPDSDQTPSGVRELLVEADIYWNLNDARAAAACSWMTPILWIRLPVASVEGTISKNTSRMFWHINFMAPRRARPFSRPPRLSRPCGSRNPLGAVRGRAGRQNAYHHRTSRAYPQQWTLVGQRRSRHGHPAVACRYTTMRKATQTVLRHGSLSQ